MIARLGLSEVRWWVSGLEGQFVEEERLVTQTSHREGGWGGEDL